MVGILGEVRELNTFVMGWFFLSWFDMIGTHTVSSMSL